MYLLTYVLIVWPALRIGGLEFKCFKGRGVIGKCNPLHYGE